MNDIFNGLTPYIFKFLTLGLLTGIVAIDIRLLTRTMISIRTHLGRPAYLSLDPHLLINLAMTLIYLPR
jgi:hypothetical protein